MDRKSREKGYIVLLKYIYIALFLISIMTGRDLSAPQVVVLLLYITVNQLRFFLLKQKSPYYYLSIILEFIISCVIYSFALRFKYLVFLPAVIDAVIDLPRVISLMYFSGVILFSFISRSSFEEIATALVCSLPIIILGGIVREEYGQKLRAQQLYDALREREEELKRVNKELENSVNTIEEITLLRERNRISREIHDNVGHALSTIIIQLGAIQSIAQSKGAAAAEMAGNLTAFANESLQSIRAAVRSMKPREFEEYEGIVAISEMIRNFEKLSGIKVSLRVSDSFWRLSADQTMVIYRIIQEFLSNSIRHGRATEVKVFLNFLPGSLRVYIKDNGIGCSTVAEGVGLRSIRERVKVWGGNLEYYSEEGKGFEIAATLEKGKLGIDEI